MKTIWKHTLVLIAGCLICLDVKVQGETANEIKLLKLARQHFTSGLSVVEEKMFRATANGEMADYLPAQAKELQETDDEDTVNAEQWSTNRVIRADRLAWLCTDAEASQLVTYRGVQITGARIDGDLDLERAKLEFALISRQCAFTKGIRLDHSDLQMLDLSGSQIEGLQADGLRVANDIFIRNGFTASGTIQLLGANIGGNLHCQDATTKTINAGGAKIGGNVFLTRGFNAVGEVNFTDATIGGSLVCDGGHFLNAEATALVVQNATIQGNVLLRDGFQATGEVDFSSASILKSLICDGGKFLNTSNTAINADSTKIGGDVFFGEGFQAEGEVNFSMATIGGNLECDGGHFSNASDTAINAEALKIQGSLIFKGEFECKGDMDFISGTVGNYLILRENQPSETMSLNLVSAKAGTLDDDARSWPLGSGNLSLDGFTYDRIDNISPCDAESRIKWLQLQAAGQFCPQPYEQLAKIMINMGHQDDAAEVLIAKNQDYARHLGWSNPRQWAQCFWYKIFGRFIGYGYKTWRAFTLSLVFIGMGYFIFQFGRKRNLILPTAEKDCAFDKHGVPHVHENYPVFNNFIYSLEMFVPLVKLGMDDNWRPYANHHTQIHFGKQPVIVSGGLLRCYLWLHILAGWILTTLWVGGLTGLVKT